MMQKIMRIKELTELLNKASDAYYNSGYPIMEDKEFDKLFDELKALETETNFIMSISPTQNVGHEVKTSLQKVEHNHPMLSLDKTKDVNDIIKFLDNRRGVIMAKMDGLTCSLRYVNGELVSAETRGNGKIGEDILHCAKTIKNLPLKIECLDEVVVDGEVIITYDDFEKINFTLPEDKKYKNPRNLASGSIRQLDSNIAAQRNMKFIAWKLVKGWMACSNMPLMTSNSFLDRLALLVRLGFSVVNYGEIPSIFAARKDVIQKDIDWIKESCKEAGYPIDGCVIGYDDIAYGESLGATEHHLNSQIAFKFEDDVYETILRDVTWDVGRSGVISPVAVFDEVDLDGALTTKATLHNLSVIEELELGIGDTITVYRSNMVIPKVDENLTRSNTLTIPDVCPCCGQPTEVKHTDNSKFLMCTNPSCTAKKIAQFTHFVSRNCMNIDGLSEKILEKLISLGYISDFKSIYGLSAHQNELVLLDGFGEKSVKKLLSAVEKSRDVKLENFIAALGIPNIGLSAAKTISNYFEGDFERFISAYKDCFDWTLLDDFGDVMAANLELYLDEHINDVKGLAQEMHFVFPEKCSSNDVSLSGLRFCITGSFSQSRDELKKKLETKGAKFVSSISKNLDVLFCGDKAGSKLTKAQSLGVRVAYEDELMEMLK